VTGWTTTFGGNVMAAPLYTKGVHYVQVWVCLLSLLLLPPPPPPPPLLLSLLLLRTLPRGCEAAVVSLSGAGAPCQPIASCSFASGAPLTPHSCLLLLLLLLLLLCCCCCFCWTTSLYRST
jgi:hypothetical protein